MKKEFNCTIEISDEAKFLAQDMDGDIFSYCDRPNHINSDAGLMNYWAADGCSLGFLFCTGIPNENWKETLIDLSVDEFDIIDGVLTKRHIATCDVCLDF